MSITFSGLASGMDTSEWVEALVAAKQTSLITPLNTKYNTLNAQKTALSKVKSTYSTLLSATQTFTDSKFSTSMDVFASNVVSSSNESKISASVTNSTPRQNVSVEVLKLATSTKAVSQNPVSPNISGDTLVSSLASGSVKEGSMSFYVGAKRYEIQVSAADSLDDIAQKMTEIAVDEDGNSLIDVSITDGKFSINSKDGSQIRVGANSDTSTLTQALSLVSSADGSVSSASSIGALDLTKPLTSVESGFYTINDEGEKVPLISEGTFIIGSAEFTITETTTMNELISKINSSTDAQVSAAYDAVQNRFILTSKQEGAFNINIEGGSSNITDVLGLTQDGNIIPDTQTLGENAELMINGSYVQTYSNTITSEVSGVAGLTLSLKDVTETGTPVNITIGQDTDSIVSEIENLVNAINSLISTSDSATASGGDLQYDSSINNLRTKIRTLASSAVDSGTYKTLASIGITTGAVGVSVDAETNQFVIDKDKLKEALMSDPDSVKELLAGENGIVQQIQDVTNQALDVESGFFKNRETSLTSQIDNINSRITAKTTYIENYQTMLEKKFQAMEKQIAAMQQSYSQMSSLLSS